MGGLLGGWRTVRLVVTLLEVIFGSGAAMLQARRDWKLGGREAGVLVDNPLAPNNITSPRGMRDVPPVIVTETGLPSFA